MKLNISLIVMPIALVVVLFIMSICNIGYALIVVYTMRNSTSISSCFSGKYSCKSNCKSGNINIMKTVFMYIVIITLIFSYVVRVYLKKQTSKR